jgi:hypothetical protein
MKFSYSLSDKFVSWRPIYIYNLGISKKVWVLNRFCQGDHHKIETFTKDSKNVYSSSARMMS